MNLKTFCFGFLAFILVSCKDNSNRWKVAIKNDIKPLTVKDISKAYYDFSVSSVQLKEEFPTFFDPKEPEEIDASRKDSLFILLNEKVAEKYHNSAAIQDSLYPIFNRLHHFFPTIEPPSIYTFTGVLSHVEPAIYNVPDKKLVIGLDWFMGEDFDLYQTMNIQRFFTQQMNPENLKPKVVESIAQQIVPHDIRHRKFIEKIIYEGKKLILEDALLPHTSDYLKIGFTPEQLKWCQENEAEIYRYFAEEQIFFNDDKSLNSRFIEPAPFSKFFTDTDTESPGRVGVWVGWQICRAYLEKHPDIDVQTFYTNNDHLQIFNESKYKPQ